VRRYNDSGYYEVRAMKTDNSGNIIATGYCNIGLNGPDIFYNKIFPLGMLKWVSTYNSTAEGSRDMAVDKYGETFMLQEMVIMVMDLLQ
jgi:hypothetical protein